MTFLSQWLVISFMRGGGGRPNFFDMLLWFHFLDQGGYTLLDVYVFYYLGLTHGIDDL